MSQKPNRKLFRKVVFFILLVLLLIMTTLGWYWSKEPKITAPTLPTSSAHVVGSTSTQAILHIINTLLDKPGGFLSNDITPPSIILDNMPNWETGALTQARDMVRALRNDFSRSQTQSTEDSALKNAEEKLNINSGSWMFPAAEDEYRHSAKQLEDYLARLSNTDDPQAQFYARADNLSSWLALVEKRLGDVSRRLSASVGQIRENTDLAGDAAAMQSTQAPEQVTLKTPWYKVDDIFYEARGTTWALIHLLKAVEIDFKAVLEKKNAQASLKQIIRELENTQASVKSPIILNGHGFGLFANHSLVMASYISSANAAVIDLRNLLTEG